MADVPDPGSEPNYVPYYPPNYIARNWAPARIFKLELWRLALGHAYLLRKNDELAKRGQPRLLNEVADRYFLANALVEDRTDFGVNRAEVDKKKDVPKECILPSAGQGGLSYDDWASADFDSVKYNMPFGCTYGMTLDYKTGAYATAVGRYDVMSRIATWNGSGPGSRNHARKVMAMHDALARPENAALVAQYRALAGRRDVFVPGHLRGLQGEVRR